jgi:small subunit ribosomal protein S6
MNRYETVFIMTPVLSVEQVAETVEKFRGILKQHGGNIVHEEAWGLRKLAYPIQKKSTGFYQLLEFEVDPTAILPFETEFRRDERILRFLSTRMDKHHVAYAERRRNKSYVAPEPLAPVPAPVVAPDLTDED